MTERQRNSCRRCGSDLDTLGWCHTCASQATADEDALLPCPFCGAKPYFCPDDSYGAASIYCPTPDCETGFACEKESPEKVIKQWNTRITAALAEKDEGWIKCSERLPEADKTVLVDGGIAYQRNGGWFSLTGIEYPGRLIQWNVTHWRPLPPLPKELMMNNKTTIGIDEQIADEKEMLERMPDTAAYAPMGRAKLATLTRYKEIMSAKMPEPVATIIVRGNLFAKIKATKHGFGGFEIGPSVYGKDLLDYALRMKAERDASLAESKYQNDKRESAERQLAELQAENKKLQADLDAEEGEHAEHIAQAKFELSELQAKHDALVKRMREPSNDMLSAMVYSWEHSFGTPFSRYKTMLNAAIDIAMSAVALRREGEK